MFEVELVAELEEDAFGRFFADARYSLQDDGFFLHDGTLDEFGAEGGEDGKGDFWPDAVDADELFKQGEVSGRFKAIKRQLLFADDEMGVQLQGTAASPHILQNGFGHMHPHPHATHRNDKAVGFNLLDGAGNGGDHTGGTGIMGSWDNRIIG